jgi:hypothetical protein
LPRRLAALRTIAPQAVEPMLEIDIVAAEPALGKKRCEQSRALALALRRRSDHHAREARRQRQIAQRTAFRRDATFCVEGAEFAQQSASLRQCRLRRRVEKGKRARIGYTPLRKIEHE